MKNCLQVFLCVCYCLMLKVTLQHSLTAQILEALNAPKTAVAAVKEKLTESQEEVHNFFAYTIEPQYYQFYKWYHGLLNADDTERKRRFGDGSFTLKSQYEIWAKSTPWPIPEDQRKYYMYMNAMEEFLNKNETNTFEDQTFETNSTSKN